VAVALERVAPSAYTAQITSTIPAAWPSQKSTMGPSLLTTGSPRPANVSARALVGGNDGLICA
jgi:hypothetical protein